MKMVVADGRIAEFNLMKDAKENVLLMINGQCAIMFHTKGDVLLIGSLGESLVPFEQTEEGRLLFSEH